MRLILIWMVFLVACQGAASKGEIGTIIDSDSLPVITGAERVAEYLPLLEGKQVAVVANHTSLVGQVHLVDTLLSLGVSIKRIFGPEHGFRGTADAGEHVKSTVDERTGIKVVSLYGNNMKPSRADLQGIDIVVFDIQDVGVRFYTYISTMHHVMDACAELDIPLVVLDRPNPNSHYVDGPVLEPRYVSFVGMHPVPLVHGLTIAEYARMINGEGWLPGGQVCSLRSITCQNYRRGMFYELPVNPSPNLQNSRSILLYPSLGLFEGTVISVGRGTPFPFQVFGHPALGVKEFKFVPVSTPGASKNPPHEGKTCHGVDLRNFSPDDLFKQGAINLEYLVRAYQHYPDKAGFFNNFFNRLAGTADLRKQIQDGVPIDTIRESWQPGIKAFLKARRPYLLYNEVDEIPGTQ